MINVFLKCKKLESHVNSKETKFGLLKIYVKCAIKNTAYIGGGGGTQIWFRRGCAAEAAKPVPYLSLRVILAEKGTFTFTWTYIVHSRKEHKITRH